MAGVRFSSMCVRHETWKWIWVSTLGLWVLFTLGLATTSVLFGVLFEEYGTAELLALSQPRILIGFAGVLLWTLLAVAYMRFQKHPRT